MTRDQIVGAILIAAGVTLPLLLLAVAAARDVIDHARCDLDARRRPTPAELACPECGTTTCTHGAVALHEAALEREVSDG